METIDFGSATLHVGLIMMHVQQHWIAQIRLYLAVRMKRMSNAQAMAR